MKKYFIFGILLVLLNTTVSLTATSLLYEKPEADAAYGNRMAALPLESYTLTFTVYDGAQVIPAAYVTCNDTFVQTDSSGVAVFSMVPAGTYPFLVNAAGFVDYTDEVTVNGNTSISIHMNNFHSIQFLITDGLNPIKNAIVVINGDTAISDTDGIALFSVTYPGNATYFYTISAEGYADSSGQLDMGNTDLEAGPIALIKTYDVLIHVKNSGDTAIAGAWVSINEQQLQTDSSGNALFTKKKTGNYSFTVSANDYVDNSGSFSISDSNKLINIVLVKGYNLFLTIINGPTGNVPLAGDTVSILGMDKVTNDTGLVVFGLKPGTYVIPLSKTGFADTSISVDISNSDTACTAYLTPSYTISFNVADALSFELLKNASVLFNGKIEQTDSMGNVVFGGVQPSDSLLAYYVTASGGFLEDTGYISVPFSSVTVDAMNSIVESVYLNRPGIGIVLTENFMAYTGSATIRIDGDSYSYDSIAGISYFRPGVGFHSYQVIPADKNKAISFGNFTLGTSIADLLEVVISNGYKLSIFTVDSFSNPIEGAQVSLDGDTILTNSAGAAIFEQKASGTYSYSIIKDAYDSIFNAQVIVDSMSVSDTVIFTQNEFSVTVVVSDESGFVQDAQVTLNGPSKSKGYEFDPGLKSGPGGIVQFTDLNGMTVFTHLLAGNYSCTVSKAGYIDSTETISIINKDVLDSIYIVVNGVRTNSDIRFRPYPNPTTGVINIGIPAQLKSYTISVINENGMILSQDKQVVSREGIISLDLQDYPGGQYIIKITGKDYEKSWKVQKN